MKKKMMLIAALCNVLGTSALAAGENDNLEGVKLCIDDGSFTAGIGGLENTSGKLAQSLYDYFVDQAAAKKIAIDELGAKTCADYSVSLDFGATTGTPRAWYGSVNLYDSTSYFSPKASDVYKQPVSVWSSAYYGVLASNGRLPADLGQGHHRRVSEGLPERQLNPASAKDRASAICFDARPC